MVTFETELEGTSESALARFVARAKRVVGLVGQVNVAVISNGAMRELNRRFRKKDKATDVLSFPAHEELGHKLAGDIAVSAEIAEQNAAMLGHSTSTELKVLVLHGLLHLAGYDHESDDGEMQRRELKLRHQLKLPESLIERARRKTGPSTTRRKDGTAALGMTKSGGTGRKTGSSATQRKGGADSLGMRDSGGNRAGRQR